MHVSVMYCSSVAYQIFKSNLAVSGVSSQDHDTV